MNNDELRRRIYAGELERLPVTSLSLALVQAVEDAVLQAFGADYRRAQFSLSGADFFQRCLELKKSVYDALHVRRAAFALMESCGFALEQNVLDPPRVRFIEHDGHLNANAEVAYKPHRDTWYANPQAQINWWVPLHDVREDETFCFYPSQFNRAIQNTSADFEYEDWVQNVGFGRSHQSKSELYPLPVESEKNLGAPTKFSLKRGEILLFSAAHLHQTLPNTAGLTRVSLDFRTVNVVDEAANVGAPNVDNHSRGSALATYLRASEQYAK